MSGHVYVIVIFTRPIKQTLQKTEGGIKNGQFKEIDNIGFTRLRQTKQKTQHNMCWTPLYAYGIILSCRFID